MGTPKKVKIRQKILETSLELFCKKGFDQVKMDEIAEQVGISTSTIYYSYFQGKQDIFETILVEEFSNYFAQLKQLQRFYSDSRKSLTRLIKGLMAFVQDENSISRLLYNASSNVEIAGLLKDHLQDFYAEYLKLISSFFEQMGDQTPSASASLFIAIFDGILFQIMYLPNQLNLDALEARLVQLFNLKS